MATVSLRVPDGLKEQMDENNDINWSAVIRSHIEDALSELDSRNVGHAVAVSERLSNAVDDEAVVEQNTAETVREWRERRYGPE